jgi:arylsulfatase A-like enzyme
MEKNDLFGPTDRGNAAQGWQGKIGRTFAVSTPYWHAPLTAPANAPNIVLIFLDDLGFSDFGCFGSEIQTPNIDKLAGKGLRFRNYTTVPMCTPARAAILTGKNPHAVGAGWLTHNNPGYPSFQAGEISLDAPTIPEILRGTGYATYAVGKWHNTADFNMTSVGDRSSWPLQRGFDRFYGFIASETNYLAPGQIVEGNDFSTIERYDDNYYCTDDFTDKAIGWVQAHHAADETKPFFLYFASNVPHTPLMARAEDRARYAGRYDLGWDALRKERFARQRAMGVVGKDWELPPRTPGVPNWDDTDPDRRPLLAAYMEIYAGMIDNLDRNIGRLIDTLTDLGQFDNTLFLITSDNGASSIGGPDGAVNVVEKRVAKSEDPALAQSMLEQGRLGAVDTSVAYPVGWANASNTPFRFYKRTPMNGGIRVPFIACWPNRITDQGHIRDGWVHATDILPTLLNLLEKDYPRQSNGFATRAPDGVSFLEMFKNADVPSARDQQYYELEGNRGLIDAGWKLVSMQPPGEKMDLSNWALFDLKTDPTEAHDVAAAHPDRVHDMIETYDKLAFADNAYPLDNRTLAKIMTHDPYRMPRVNRPTTFYPNAETVPALMASRLIADRDFELTCPFDWVEGDQGVLFALGDVLRGFAAFVISGELVVHYNGGLVIKRDLRLPLQSGNLVLRMRHRAYPGRLGAAQITIERDGANVASGELDMSPNILLLSGEGFDVGLDRRTAASAEYADLIPFAYSGMIRHVHIAPGRQAAGSEVNRAEELSQKDW